MGFIIQVDITREAWKYTRLQTSFLAPVEEDDDDDDERYWK